MAFDGVFTHYLLKELSDNLLSGRINKIYQISNYELIFVIRAKSKTQKLLISIHPVYARLHLTNSDYTNPQDPPMFCMFLRKHLDGGIIVNIHQKENDRIIIFDIEHINEIGDKDTLHLVVEVMGKHSNIILVNNNAKTILDCIKHIPPFQNSVRTLLPGANYTFPPTNDKVNFLKATKEDFLNFNYDDSNLAKQIVKKFEGVSPILAKEIIFNSPYLTLESIYKSYQEIKIKLNQQLNPSIIYTQKKDIFYLIPLNSVDGKTNSYENISKMLDRYYFNKDEKERIKQKTQDLKKYIKNELDKNNNKLENLKTDLLFAKDAVKYKIYGELITANAYSLEKGMNNCNLVNYYEESNPKISIPLNPLLTPIENAQKYFHKYQKGKKAISHIDEQIELTKEEINYFETLLEQMESASLNDALEIRQELEQGRYLKRNVSKKTKKQKPQYESYLVDDIYILVGKNNLQNDYLTFKVANRFDMWMHVKDMPGSHVIIKSQNELSEKIIRTASQLAAYYSKGRQSSSVPIDYTRVKNVKKIPGAKPGFVTYDNQKTIFIDPDEDFIHSLTKKK